MKKSFKGFTLVEVLIVIIIVAILIAALLPRLTGTQARARDNARLAAVNQVANGVALMLNDAGTLTTQGVICADDLANFTGTVNGAAADLGDYMSSIPVDPQSNHVNLAAAEACTGAVWTYSSGTFVFLYSSLEGTNNANTDAPATTDDTDAEFQALLTAGGTEGFGVLVR